MRELLRVAALARREWPRVLLGVLLSLGTLLANLALLALSSWFIASMAIAGSLRVALDYTLPSAGVRALALGRAAGRYAERLVNHSTTFRILADLRVWFFRRIEPLAPARLVGFRGGDLLSRIRADIDTLDDFYVRGVVPFVVALFALACIVAFLAHFDVRLAGIDAALLAFSGLLLPLVLKKLAEAPGRERVARAADLRASIVEETQGMAELVALGALDWHAERIRASSRAMDRAQRSLASLQGIGDAGLVAAGALSVWLSALVLIPVVTEGRLPRADMAMLTVFMLATFETIAPLPAVIQRVGEMAAAARRLFEIIDAAPAIREPPPGTKTSFDAPPRAVDLSIRGLGFRYGPGEPWVFESLSLEAPAGSRIGIVAPTGAGKSSLFNVLLRFWEYERGEILVGGGAEGATTELRDVPSDEARRLFSIAPQTPYLFHTTVRENLELAREGASDDELWEALECARLADYVAKLPERLDAAVGEGGVAFSAGQAQRIAVARALLKDARIYLFDEPTEGLDDATADALLEGVARFLKGRSLLLASHRSRDLAVVDRVVELGPRPRSGS